MSYTVHNFDQHSPEWNAHRRSHFNASEAAAMLGMSSKVKRNELLHMKKTLSDKEFSDWVQQNIIDPGHEFEEAARPFAEEIIGEDLFRTTCSLVVGDLPLSASYDGHTESDVITFEHKRLNKELEASLRAGIVPDEHWPQVEQQLLIKGAERCLFMASDGTRESMVHAWYVSDPKRREQLLAGWKQFAIDLENYVPVEAPAPVVAKPVTDLPAVLVQVKGQIDITDNFKLFETALKDFIANRLIREPKTDQDFADLELQVKALKKAEDALDSAESMMLAQVSSIDMAKRQKDMLHELARTNRLLAEKLVKSEKENRRLQIVKGGDIAWIDHVQQINKTLGGKIALPHIPSNFVGVVKGLKSISSMQNAVDTELARVKIEANRVADGIRINLASLRELSAGYEFLFTDAQQLVLKANDDLVNLIKSRVSEHKAEQERKLEIERERIRAEEKAKAEKTAAVEVKPVAQQMAAAQSAPTAQTKRAPSSKEIVDVLVKHYAQYGWDRNAVVGWLKNFDSIAA